MTARALTSPVVFLMVLGLAACGRAPAPVAPVPPVAVAPAAPLPPSEFAPAVLSVLTQADDGGEVLLTRVVSAQLERARARFAAGHPDEGLRSVTGALYLVRAPELSPAMWTSQPESLALAARAIAARGDEGGAEALYSLLARTLPEGLERADALAHLKALEAWSGNLASKPAIVALGAKQRVAAARSLLEPTRDVVAAAAEATRAWIEAAAEADLDSQPPGSMEEREARLATYRALSSGGASLMALYLRQRDVEGALSALDEGKTESTMPVALREWLRHASKGDARAWGDLFRWYRQAATERSEVGVEPLLASAAAFGAAVEQFRAAPSGMGPALALGSTLESYGLTEAVPLVLARAVREAPTPENLSAALSLVLRGVFALDALGERDGARRTFALSEPLLVESAKHPELRAPAARAYYAMASVETRAAELPEAKRLALRSLELEPSVDALALLARVSRQSGATGESQDALRRLQALAAARGASLASADASLIAFELARDANDEAAASAALAQALTAALAGRQGARSPAERAASERVLARVLELYGDAPGARRAAERAYEAADGDAGEVRATLLDTARRGLALGDVAMARTAVRRAMERGVADDDLVYAALWLQLLERQLGAGSDGTVSDALERAATTSPWAGKLSAWARGQLSGEELERAARTPSEQAEARFYVAMTAPSGARAERLRAVATSPAVDLIEVTIARDELARGSSRPPALPANVALP